MSIGYSNTPQARKLGLTPGLRVRLDNVPPGWQLANPPTSLVYVGIGEPADLFLSFFARAAELPVRLPTLARSAYPDGAIWAAWPRRAAGHSSDITDNVIREHALPLGIVDVKVAAIDLDWSGLRLVWRLAKRQQSNAP